jgi:hypothetical protein
MLRGMFVANSEWQEDIDVGVSQNHGCQVRTVCCAPNHPVFWNFD